MCIIIIKQKGRVVPNEVIKRSSKINPHGLGVVYLDTFEVSFHKSSEYSVLKTNRPYIAHFRYATIGKICKENSHPFICGRNTDELLMMNGTAKGYGSADMTDTQDIAIRLGDSPRHKWKSYLSKFDARFVSINTRTRSFQIYNKEDWIIRNGVWYSKENVFADHLVAVYGTLKKGYTNYQYLKMKNEKFIGQGVTNDKYPLVVSGLPYLIDKKGKGQRVEVDVFKVSRPKLRSLDSLEGHPRFYERRLTKVYLPKKKLYLDCWVYFSKSGEHLWNGSNHTNTYKQSNRFTDNYKSKPKFSFNSYATSNNRVYYTPSSLTKSDYHNDECHSHYCVECFNDLVFDGVSNEFECTGCGARYSKDTIESSSC